MSAFADLWSIERYQKFTSFRHLPLELRTKIWEEAFPDPRYIEIKSVIRRNNGRLEFANRNDIDEAIRDPEYRIKLWAPWCRHPPPSMLHACFESRKIALKRFSIFQGTLPDAKVWIDLKHDILVFSDSFYGEHFKDFITTADPNVIKRIRTLSIDLRFPIWEGKYLLQLNFPKFKSLKHIYFRREPDSRPNDRIHDRNFLDVFDLPRFLYDDLNFIASSIINRWGKRSKPPLCNMEVPLVASASLSAEQYSYVPLIAAADYVGRRRQYDEPYFSSR